MSLNNINQLIGRPIMDRKGREFIIVNPERAGPSSMINKFNDHGMLINIGRKVSLPLPHVSDEGDIHPLTTRRSTKDTHWPEALLKGMFGYEYIA